MSAEHRPEAAIVDATNQLFAAMRSRDGAALERAIHPRAQVLSLRGDVLKVRTGEEFIASVLEAPDPVDERIHDADVRVDGDIAALWARYDVHFGARYSHHGCDSFQFVRENGAWRLVSAVYTVRTED